MIVVGFAMPVAFADVVLGDDFGSITFNPNNDGGVEGEFIIKNGGSHPNINNGINNAAETFNSGRTETTITTLDGTSTKKTSSLTVGANNVTLVKYDENGAATEEGLTLSGVKDGEISAISTEAVNGKQLNKVDIKADAAQDTADQAIINAKAADDKAVAAQGTANTALNNAKTADDKAVAAQGTADQAIINAKAADDKAVAAQGTANTALNNAKTADDKAVAAQNDLNDYRTQTDTTLGLHAGRISQNETDIIGLKSDVADIRHDLRNQKDEYRAGIASLAAMTNIPTVPGKTFSAGMGVGNFKNKTAFAAGANWNVNENVSTKFSVGFESSDVTIGTGVAFGF